MRPPAFYIAHFHLWMARRFGDCADWHLNRVGRIARTGLEIATQEKWRQTQEPD